MGFALTKRQQLAQAKLYVLLHTEHGSQVSDVAEALGVTYQKALRHLVELGAVRIGQRRYRLIPTPEDIELARAVLNIPDDAPRDEPGSRISHMLTAVAQAQATDPTPTKAQRLEQIRRRLLLHRGRSVHILDLVNEFGLSYHLAWIYLRELGATGSGRGRYRLLPSQEDIELAQAVLDSVKIIADASERISDGGKASPTERGRLKQQMLERAKMFLLLHQGLTADELASMLGSALSSTYHYLHELGATQDGNKKYHLTPAQDDIEFAQAVLQTRQTCWHMVQTRVEGERLTKRQRLDQLKRLLLLNQQGLTAREIAAKLNILPRAVWRYLHALGAVADRNAKYRLIPTPEDIELAGAIMWAITMGNIGAPGRKTNP